MLLEQLLGQQGQPMDARTRLLQALAKRAPAGKANARDARYRSLAALPPYAEQKHGETFQGRGANDFGAFQSDAFDNDGFQVEIF